MMEEKLSIMPKITLFLGAGASVQFGNPATKEIKEQLETRIDKKILPLLKLFPDIEYVLTCLKQLQDIEPTPLGKFLKNDEFEIEKKTDLTNIKILMNTATEQFNLIMRYLFETYNITEEKIQNLKEFFDNLFRVIGKYSNSLDVGTTNYDLSIEMFCNRSGSDYNLIDGFMMNSNRSRFNKSIFDKIDQSKKNVRLYKIHGSLNWIGNPPYIEKHNNIQFSRIGGDSPSIIIPPTLFPKDNGMEIFSDLLKLYSVELLNSDVCVVIGFSFRDDHISQYFKKFIEEGKRLIIISPSCQRDYAINLFRGKDDRATESEINEYANTHVNSNDRKVNFINLRCDEKNNSDVFIKLEYILSKIFV